MDPETSASAVHEQVADSKNVGGGQSGVGVTVDADGDGPTGPGPRATAGHELYNTVHYACGYRISSKKQMRLLYCNILTSTRL